MPINYPALQMARGTDGTLILGLPDGSKWTFGDGAPVEEPIELGPLDEDAIHDIEVQHLPPNVANAMYQPKNQGCFIDPQPADHPHIRPWAAHKMYGMNKRVAT